MLDSTVEEQNFENFESESDHSSTSDSESSNNDELEENHKKNATETIQPTQEEEEFITLADETLP